jgi:hypothetical protein
LARLLLLTGCASLLLAPPLKAADQDQPGRDFPKTLIFDEPGIDDEVSLPTIIFAPEDPSGQHETDLNFELDKRLTQSVSVQINIGYSLIPQPAAPTRTGWQDAQATLKIILFDNPAAERLVSLSLIRDFGATGAARIGVTNTSATTAALNIGQGFAPYTASPILKPFALTGSAGILIPDATHQNTGDQAIISASLQYSLDVLFNTLPQAGAGRLAIFRPLIPIIEFTTAQPLTGTPARTAIASPGLIYSGDGFQLAAEALLPLSRASGTHVGFIAQLNISLRTLGIAALARPVFN